MPAIEVTPFSPADIPGAVDLFVQDILSLHEAVPALAPNLADPKQVADLLTHIFSQCPGLAARLDGKLAGYLGWYLVPDFRSTGRLGAYVPEWAHSSVHEQLPLVYQPLYSAATTLWTAEGCQIHAITHLAHNRREQDFWFWNGFGLLVVDAIRPMQPLDGNTDTRLTIRKAVSENAEALHELDIEHRRHYTQPPVLMAPRNVTSTEEFVEFINRPENAIWMAWDGPTPAGFIRFDAYEVEAATLLESEGSAFISGAYVRPDYRNLGAARAMLNAALIDFTGRGYRCCVLDFESFNPQARSFWLRYFQPVAYSLMRMPESTG
jgi:ribosomal protein S18 acetylase RimI-like enzyme